MSLVKKLNKVYTVPTEAVKSYLEDGYDEIDGVTGEVVKGATAGKTVTIQELNIALDEVAKLKEEVKKLKAENAKTKKGE